MADKGLFAVKIQRFIKLTTEDIDDIMSDALEGGINYWCENAYVVEEKRAGEWGHEQIARGGALILTDAYDGEKYELNLEKFLVGFKKWFEEGGDLYHAVRQDGTLDAGNVDATVADSIVQYAVFGELVYG